MEQRLIALLDKCEALSLLCSKATSHWSMIRFIFQIPLILTSSVMCILNSFEKDGENNMKIPNVVVNGVSVLLLSLQSNLKVPEKVELFKNLSNQFLLLAHDIEGEGMLMRPSLSPMEECWHGVTVHSSWAIRSIRSTARSNCSSSIYFSCLG